jgi:Fic family protein
MSKIESLLAEYNSTIIEVEQNQHERFNQYTIVHHSNEIENSTLTLDETTLILEHHQSPAGKPMHDVFMATNHYDALRYVLALAMDKAPLSHEVIQKIGAKIMKNTGGEVQSINGLFDNSLGDYRTVIERAGESIFPDPKKVQPLMNELIMNINQSIQEPKTIEEKFNLSFDVHFQAVSIHPFGDGNGRFSRLMMNYIQAYHDLPLMYLFAEDKQAYFNALKETRASENLQVFRDYMTEATLKCLNQQINDYKNPSKNLKEKDKDNGRLISVLF